MATPVALLRSTTRFRCTKGKPKAWSLRKSRIQEEKHDEPQEKNHNPSDSISFKGNIPARISSKFSRNTFLAKGMGTSAGLEREVMLKSELPLSSKPCVKLSSPADTLSDAVENDSLKDPSMELCSLSSRSPTLSTAQRSPRSSLDRRSSVSRRSDHASRKRSRGRECQQDVPPRKRRVRRYSPSSQALRSKSRNASCSIQRSFGHSPRKAEATEASVKTSILTKNKGSNPGIIQSERRSNSVSRTIVLPVWGYTGPRRASKSRSRSLSRHGTPIPSPKFVDGYRTLASDRDIHELLQQRLAQSPRARHQAGTPDLKGWNPGWNTSCLNDGNGGKAVEVSVLRKDQEVKVKACVSSESLQVSNAATQWQVRSMKAVQAGSNNAMDSQQEHCGGYGDCKPHIQKPSDRIDHTDVTARLPGMSGKGSSVNSLSSCGNRVKISDGDGKKRGRNVSVDMTPLILVQDRSKLACSACSNNGCRCIRLTDGICERCKDQNLHCVAITRTADTEREGEPQHLQKERRHSQTGQHTQIRAEYPPLYSSTHFPVIRPAPVVNYAALQCRDLPPIENLHFPQAPPLPTSPILPSDRPGGSASLPLHAQSQSQRGYGRVQHWNIVQPQRLQSERNSSPHQASSNGTYEYSTHTAQHPHAVIATSHNQKVQQNSQSFSARQYTCEADADMQMQSTQSPRNGPAAASKVVAHSATFLDRLQQHPPNRGHDPDLHFSRWGPMNGSRHLPHPQPRPRQ